MTLGFAVVALLETEEKGTAMNTEKWLARAKRLPLLLVAAAIGGLTSWVTYGPLVTGTAPESPAAAAAPAAAAEPAAAAVDRKRAVAALGRLQPKDGVIRVAGPSQVSVVISQLLVEKGDTVKAGQVIAVLDNYELLKAEAEKLSVELEHARSESQRHDELYRSKVVSVSERDNWRMKVHTLEAALHGAEVELDHAAVRAPIDGQVLDIHARAGEKVGPDGIVELGKTDEMYAIAEVYETDIGRVRVGQRAVVKTPALAEPVQGTVERVGLKIGKLDVLGTDPVAQTDARVVEVEIRLDNSQKVAGLTNLQVQVVITP